jgi:hypothetical protein
MESNKNSQTMLKGCCHWFAKVNKTCYGIRLCRNGSLCPYLHLTGDEIDEIVNHGDELVNCKSCLYKLSAPPTQDIMEMCRRQMPCDIKCSGGKVKKTQIIVTEARERIWCKCPDHLRTKFGDTYYRPGTHPKSAEHVHVCNRCKCIQNVLSV